MDSTINTHTWADSSSLKSSAWYTLYTVYAFELKQRSCAEWSWSRSFEPLGLDLDLPCLPCQMSAVSVSPAEDLVRQRPSTEPLPTQTPLLAHWVVPLVGDIAKSGPWKVVALHFAAFNGVQELDCHLCIPSQSSHTAPWKAPLIHSYRTRLVHFVICESS